MVPKSDTHHHSIIPRKHAYESLHKDAKLVDHLIDAYRKNRNVSFIPQNELRDIIQKIFPDLFVESNGWHKAVFGVCYHEHELILKIGRKEDIEKDHRVYKHLPKDIRHAYFAKIFWHTKYCLLQEYGVEAYVPMGKLIQLRRIGTKHGIIDVTRNNIRSVNGDLKIIDANIMEGRLSRFWELVDSIKLFIPKRATDIVFKRQKQGKAITYNP